MASQSFASFEASALVATEGSSHNDGEFKFDCWTTANQSGR